jgi:aromatic ring-opening dioxygenase catalytic subunit (LigB family)
MNASRMPVFFVPHGGGPWPFVDFGLDRRELEPLADYLRSLPAETPPPAAMLVVSAHWEAPVPTVTTAEHPPMVYDYYGFPPEAYAITWPAPGSPALARRVRELLGSAGIPTAEDPRRGFDHGTFVPLKVAFPEANVPTVQLSMKKGVAPSDHVAMGRALAPLRDERILVVGSGMTYHDMRGFGSAAGADASERFDAWLVDAATAEPATRDERLADWTSAPSARQAHPREEHLLPLMVVAGVAGTDRGRVAFSGRFAKTKLSAFHFG